MQLFNWLGFNRKKKNNWSPVPHFYIKDEALRNVIHEEGIKVIPFLDSGQLTQLKELYASEHDIQDAEGGMFYSVYSQDVAYRKRVHDQIDHILRPSLDAILSGYRPVLNSFIIKAPGPKSEFALHQDTTGLDEQKYSALNIWIALEDVGIEDGALCVVRKSHHFFSPYRSISFPPPYKNISDIVRQYLEPITVKAGEAIVFDNRLLHNSLPNLSGKPRVAVVSGIFPKEANLMTCFKDPSEPTANIELIEHPDDFLLTHPNFLIDCHTRPPVGKTIGFVKDEYPMMTAKEFENLCKKNGIVKRHFLMATNPKQGNLIGEPIHITNSKL
ncbi:MAG: phytanoyl-CoA dioxygenase family protein [Saprospiraceae bacterium]